VVDVADLSGDAPCRTRRAGRRRCRSTARSPSGRSGPAPPGPCPDSPVLRPAHARGREARHTRARAFVSSRVLNGGGEGVACGARRRLGQKPTALKMKG
jgi:hypothetical protein